MGDLKPRLTFSNVVAVLALFVALGGVSYAALAKNSVKSRTIAPGAVKNSDLASDAATGAKVAEATLEGVNADLLDGVDSTGYLRSADADGFLKNSQADGFVGEGDAAGGDFSGAYPNPQVAPGAVTPEEIGAIPAARLEGPRVGFLTFVFPPPPAPPSPVCGADYLTADPNDDTVVHWIVEVFDTQNLHIQPLQGGEATTEHCAAGSRLTAPIRGIYSVTAGVHWPSNADGARFISLRVNGDDTNGYVAGDRRPAVNGIATEQTVSTLVKLNQGDYVEVVLHQNSAASPELDTFQHRNFFSMHWVAPG